VSNCVTTSTRASRCYCLVNWVSGAERRQTIAGSLKLCCELGEPVVRGGTCPLSSGGGTACTSASRAGRVRAYGIGFSPSWPTVLTLKSSSSTAPSCVPTSTRQAPQKNVEQDLDRSCGGLSTTIPALVDGLRMLTRFRLTGGQAGDSPEALPLLGELQSASDSADKAYDTDNIIAHLQQHAVQAVIPSRANRRI
jgi:hypothetical protein